MSEDLFDGPVMVMTEDPADLEQSPSGYAKLNGFTDEQVEEIVNYYGDERQALEWMQLVVRSRTENLILDLPPEHCPQDTTGKLYPDGRAVYTPRAKTVMELADERRTKIVPSPAPSVIPTPSSEIPLIPDDLLPNSESAATENSNSNDGQSDPATASSSTDEPVSGVSSAACAESSDTTATVPAALGIPTNEFLSAEYDDVREEVHARKAATWEPVTEDDIDFVGNWFAELDAEAFRVTQQYERRMASINRRKRCLEYKYLPKVEAWAKRQIAGKKQKYVDLASVRLQFRTVAAHWKITDDNLLRGFVSRLSDAAKTALKVTAVTLWRWEDIKLIRQMADALKAKGESVPGLEWIPERESFKVVASNETEPE